MRDPLREKLAALCHDQWSGWMRYLFSLCVKQLHETNEPPGEVIPGKLVRRWRRQMATPYASLSEGEQDSDRKEADRFLALLKSSVVRVGVSGILTNGVGGVLLGKRKGSHGAGTWAFPGGHLEPGETIVDCALRETLEETGLYPGSAAETGQVTNDIFEAEGLHYITIFVLMGIRAGEIPQVREPEKCEEWRWFPWEEMPPRDQLFLPVRNLRATGYRPPM